MSEYLRPSEDLLIHDIWPQKELGVVQEASLLGGYVHSQSKYPGHQEVYSAHSVCRANKQYVIFPLLVRLRY